MFPLSVKESVALTFCHGNRGRLAGNGGLSACGPDELQGEITKAVGAS